MSSSNSDDNMIDEDAANSNLNIMIANAYGDDNAKDKLINDLQKSKNITQSEITKLQKEINELRNINQNLNASINNKPETVLKYDTNTLSGTATEYGYGVAIMKGFGFIFSMITFVIYTILCKYMVCDPGETFYNKYFNIECIASDSTKFEWKNKMSQMYINWLCSIIFGCLLLLGYIITRSIKKNNKLQGFELIFLCIEFGSLSIWIWWSILLTHLYNIYYNLNQKLCDTFIENFYYDKIIIRRYILFVLLLGIVSIFTCYCVYITIWFVKTRERANKKIHDSNDYDKLAITSDYSTEADDI